MITGRKYKLQDNFTDFNGIPTWNLLNSSNESSYLNLNIKNEVPQSNLYQPLELSDPLNTNPSENTQMILPLTRRMLLNRVDTSLPSVPQGTQNGNPLYQLKDFYVDALKYSQDKSFGDQLFIQALGESNLDQNDKSLVLQTALDSQGLTRASTYQSAFNSGSFDTAAIFGRVMNDKSLNSKDLTSLYKKSKDLLTRDERRALKAKRNEVENAEWKNSPQKAQYEAKLTEGSKSAGVIADGVDSLFATNKKVTNQSDFTQGANKAYDTTSTALVSSGNPYAMMAGAIMKANGFVVDGLTAMGIGTDQMTAQDKILDSKWLKMTPTGLVNAAFTKKSDKFAVDTDTQAAQGSAYTGSYIGIEKAANKAGKKYGLFSSGARKRANRYITEQRGVQDQIQDINESTEDQLAMGSYYGNAYKTYNDLNGGYNNVQIGQLGMKIEKAKQTLKNRKEKVQESRIEYDETPLALNPDDVAFAKFASSLPKSLRLTGNDGYNMRRYWELNGKPENFLKGSSLHMFNLVKDDNGLNWHANSVAQNPETGNYEFMKNSNHPSHYMELDWYNSDDPEAKAFKNEYEYVPGADGWDQYIKRPEPLDSSLIYPQEFKEGGKVNVIPTGALHARLNHMNVEDITHKGIPVITEEKGGIVQHAEIERDEIIFNLDVTKKLEELAKKYEKEQKDEYAIEAGKLLAKEIMTNTEDNTGLIEKVTGNENNEN